MVSTLLLIAGCILLVAVGLMSLIHDLLGRGPHEAPLIEDDGLPRPRFQAPDATGDSPKNLRVDIEPCGGGRR